MQPSNGKVYMIPAPVGGWNARDPLAVMQETDAVILDNVFPEANLCRVIGAGTLTDSTPIVNGAFETFADYYPSTGSPTGIVVDKSFFRVVTSSGTFTGGTFASGGFARWQHTNMNNSILFVNGLAAPVAYDGTTWSNPSYTGTGLTVNKLSNIDTYKSRLFFVEDQSLKIWYGNVRAISGALTLYDVSGICRRGGSIVYAGSVIKDAYGGVNDFFVIVTDQGEVLYFSGDNPGASNWQIVGRAQVGIPLGKRAFCQKQSDLLVATTEGIVSLNALVDSGHDLEFVTDKIQTAYNDAAVAATSYDGWELRYWAAGHMLILNVPQSYPTDIQQYVMNTFTGAWCRFKGIQASTLCILQNKCFFTVRGASNNEIKTLSGGTAPPADIEIQSAYIPLGDASNIKQVKRIRPFFSSPRPFQYYLECAADFEEKTYSNLTRPTSTTQTPWGSPWGSPWSSGATVVPTFYSVDSRTGTFFSYKIKTNAQLGSIATAPTNTNLSAVSFIFEDGGII